MNTEFERAKIFSFNDIIDYAPNSVISKTIIKNLQVQLLFFSFDKDEALSEHTAPFDAMVQVIDGSAEILIDGKNFPASFRKFYNNACKYTSCIKSQ